MSTTEIASISDNIGGVIVPQLNTLIWISLIILPINDPFLYSLTFIANTPERIPGGVIHKFPVLASNVDPPPTGFVDEYGAIKFTVPPVFEFRGVTKE